MALLSLDQATTIIDAALAEGRARHFAPLAVAGREEGVCYTLARC